MSLDVEREPTPPGQPFQMSDNCVPNDAEGRLVVESLLRGKAQQPLGINATNARRDQRRLPLHRPSRVHPTPGTTVGSAAGKFGLELVGKHRPRGSRHLAELAKLDHVKTSFPGLDLVDERRWPAGPICKVHLAQPALNQQSR